MFLYQPTENLILKKELKHKQKCKSLQSELFEIILFSILLVYRILISI